MNKKQLKQLINEVIQEMESDLPPQGTDETYKAYFASNPNKGGKNNLYQVNSVNSKVPPLTVYWSIEHKTWKEPVGDNSLSFHTTQYTCEPVNQ